MSQWGWSVPSWVNNSHSDFWLGLCPWSQEMGDSSAAVVAFHLLSAILYKCKVAVWEKFQCEVSNQ